MTHPRSITLSVPDDVRKDPRGGSALSDGAGMQISCMHWESVLCPELPRTLDSHRAQDAPVTPDFVLRFELSQNEEHAYLRLDLDGRRIDLGERIHHYLLAILARLRLRDAQRGLASHSQGWVPTVDLARMLGVEPSHANIQIFRARRQFARVLVPHVAAPLLVERRRGEVRLGEYRFTVRRGEQIEGGSP